MPLKKYLASIMLPKTKSINDNEYDNTLLEYIESVEALNSVQNMYRKSLYWNDMSSLSDDDFKLLIEARNRHEMARQAARKAQGLNLYA